jgi:hypothetical protein
MHKFPDYFIIIITNCHYFALCTISLLFVAQQNQTFAASQAPQIKKSSKEAKMLTQVMLPLCFSGWFHGILSVFDLKKFYISFVSQVLVFQTNVLWCWKKLLHIVSNRTVWRTALCLTRQRLSIAFRIVNYFAH